MPSLLPAATRLFEAHLTVTDVDRSIAFYRDVVGLRLALDAARAQRRLLLGRRPRASRCSACGRSARRRWASCPTSPSARPWRRSSARAPALRAAGIAPLSFFGTDDRRAERDRLDAGGRGLLPRSGRAPARVSRDARRRPAARAGHRVVVAVGPSGRARAAHRALRRSRVTTLRALFARGRGLGRAARRVSRRRGRARRARGRTRRRASAARRRRRRRTTRDQEHGGRAVAAPQRHRPRPGARPRSSAPVRRGAAP